MKTCSGPPPNSCVQRRGGTGSMLYSNYVFPTMGIFKEFVYADTFTLSSTTSISSSGTGAYYQPAFLYGPMLSGPGTSHQPYEFDQISGLYKYFQVYEFGFNIEFADPSTSSCWCVVSVNPSGDANYSVSTMLPRNAMEKVGCQYTTISSTGERRTVITGRHRVWDVDGIKYGQFLANPNYQGNNGANPNLSPVIGMAIGDHNSPVSTSSVKVSVKLFMKAKWWSTITQAAS